MEENKLSDFDQWIKSNLDAYRPAPPPAPGGWGGPPTSGSWFGLSAWKIFAIAGTLILGGSAAWFVAHENKPQPIVSTEEPHSPNLETPVIPAPEKNQDNLHVSQPPINEIENGRLNRDDKPTVSQGQTKFSEPTNNTSNNAVSPNTNLPNNQTTNSNYTTPGRRPEIWIPGETICLKKTTFSLISFGDFKQVEIRFSDGGSKTIDKLGEFQHKFTTAGTFGIWAKAGDAEWEIGKVNVTAPHVDFEFLDIQPSTFRFTGDLMDDMMVHWDFGDGSQASGTEVGHEYTDGQTKHTVTLRAWYPDANKPVIVSHDITLQMRSDKPSVPNAFTPNGDGANEEFQVVGFSPTGFSMVIMDGNGKKVFESNNPNASWNGIDANGMPYKAGTYYLFLQYQDDSGNARQYKTSIQLIR